VQSERVCGASAHAGAFCPQKHGSLLSCAQSELSEEAALCCGTWTELLHAGHPGIYEVKWCSNRFFPFLVVKPASDGAPAAQDAEEFIEVRSHAPPHPPSAACMLHVRVSRLCGVLRETRRMRRVAAAFWQRAVPQCSLCAGWHSQAAGTAKWLAQPSGWHSQAADQAPPAPTGAPSPLPTYDQLHCILMVCITALTLHLQRRARAPASF
jgi:hypothetical protein